MRISDWSSDVCSSDLASKFITVDVIGAESDASAHRIAMSIANSPLVKTAMAGEDANWGRVVMAVGKAGEPAERDLLSIRFGMTEVARHGLAVEGRSEEHTSELQSLMRISYAVFCLKKKKLQNRNIQQ